MTLSQGKSVQEGTGGHPEIPLNYWEWLFGDLWSLAARHGVINGVSENYSSSSLRRLSTELSVSLRAEPPKEKKNPHPVTSSVLGSVSEITNFLGRWVGKEELPHVCYPAESNVILWIIAEHQLREERRENICKMWSKTCIFRYHWRILLAWAVQNAEQILNSNRVSSQSALKTKTAWIVAASPKCISIFPLTHYLFKTLSSPLIIINLFLSLEDMVSLWRSSFYWVLAQSINASIQCCLSKSTGRSGLYCCTLANQLNANPIFG